MKTIKIKNSNKEITIGKIVCVGRNYAEHVQELGNTIPEKPVVFLKPVSSVIYSGDEIVCPAFSNDMHHESELVLLIGENIKNADLEISENAITGYGIGLDMTLRDVQSELKKKGHPWTIAKCFDTSTVLSEFIEKSAYQLSLDETISLKVNDEFRQKDQLNKMLFKPAEIVQYISTLMTLEKGDLIFTGTPKGVSKVVSGDKLVAQLDGLIKLECSVR
ncbi:MAG: 2-oxopent-4-enoate hydratase [Ignavibacteriales bacterium UTCHB2]|jgi:5-carboxymethyl-2-hydroxymuconate isomerase|nr:MAG: Fumarylpyruvate hydrolase [Ignavibacteria bacterium ADurb.Bin266]OQY72654.1 MAG: 2-oxopent-4-enoate hydratase [Ignavibacteriales bacterium UTCHB2]HQI39974.1 fumarylacetoacetate hydrolase family protein [Ignavibacteriaceae bacterium]HQJ45171.1 fumarylacetoacetate hydrolase family protein [Ignavibacteriaceae bacterium]